MHLNQVENNLFLFIILLVAFMPGLIIDLYVPSLNFISIFFHATSILTKLTISSCLSGYAIGQLIFGFLSDVLGRKKMLIFGLIIFLIASALTFITTNIYVFIFVRFIQGLSAASASVITKVIIADNYINYKKLEHGMIYFGIISAVPPVIAPVVGGYIAYFFGWQGAFSIYILYSSILILLVTFFLKETYTNKVTFAFIANSLKDYLTNKEFILVIVATGLCYSPTAIFNTIGSLLIQEVLGKNPVVFGYTAMILGLGMILGSILTRIVYVNKKFLLNFSAIIMLIVSVLILIVNYKMKPSLSVIVPSFLIFFLLDGLTFPIFLSMAIQMFHKTKGMTSSFIGAGFILISSISSLLVSVLDFSSMFIIACLLFIITLMYLITVNLLLNHQQLKLAS